MALILNFVLWRLILCGINILGLRYDDLYDPYYDIDVKEALNRLPREIVDARNQRLKRAMDLSMKHKYLPDDLQVCFYYGLLDQLEPRRKTEMCWMFIITEYLNTAVCLRICFTMNGEGGGRGITEFYFRIQAQLYMFFI